MLDYEAAKKFFADKLAQDLEGRGRLESAAFHTVKFVYLKGVEDGIKHAKDNETEIGVK